MTTHHALVLIGAAALALSACQSSDTAAASDDPSKLNAELETEARAIEQRASAAVAEADRAAAADLREIEARTQADTTGAAEAQTADAAGAATEGATDGASRRADSAEP